MCSDTQATANFCCMYSMVGSLFMLMVIMMLTYQPLLVGGIDSTEEAKANAYGAMFTFVVTFVLSVFYLIKGRLSGGIDDGHRNTRRRWGDNLEYDGIHSNRVTADGASVFQDYALNLDLPESVQEGVFS